MFAPNAYGPLLRPDIVDNAPETHTGADAGNDPEKPAFQMPLVYPFIPAPSISMEPMTPENNRATLSDQTPPASVSQLSTPSLSFSDDHDSSPDSRPSSAKRTVGTGPVEFGDSNLKEEEEEEEETTPPPSATSMNPTPTHDDPDKTKAEAICILTYMRAFPNSETSQPAVIADGQIWRSPDKKKGWRRNQWLLMRGRSRSAREGANGLKLAALPASHNRDILPRFAKTSDLATR
ncbi:hypothetical protein FKW77_006393 [Venturia effusa]|uniref:Uncharacterized protein n=1 Tax=Venturia effusa TaxID=50376 RepID=A0A517LP78_9PEZI|nr:hypothetical protein FKW77_006393 [Venturia effusa]